MTKEEKKKLKLLEYMKLSSTNRNMKFISLIYDDIHVVNEYGENLLHVFTSEKYDEEKCFALIKTLLINGVNPNHLDNCKYDFIQTAIDTGYSETFVMNCIREALKHSYNVNNQDEDGDTIMHNAINADDYKSGLIDLFNLLLLNGYNAKKLNKAGKGIDDLMFETRKYNNAYKRKVIIEFDKELSRPDNLKVYKR